ncbi:MAG: hypothetical protein JNL62_03570 [Bryobacterales bacterium]|nr:hypothetical protein [Bryobacterales bacterium]
MLAALALAASLADCVPMRWSGAHPLTTLDGSPITCLLLEEPQWTLIEEARSRGLRTLAIVRTQAQAERAAKRNPDAIVSESSGISSTMPMIHLGARNEIRFDTPAPIIGTSQAVWPGIEIEHGGPKATSAAPTGSAWIHTNTGFLRFVRAVAKAPFWLANTPPPGTAFPAKRYAQAVSDAAAAGARWVLAFDDKLPPSEWKPVFDTVRFYEAHSGWRAMKPWAEVAIVQDERSGALITGSLLDMLSVMNTPVRAIPSRQLNAAAIEGAKVTVAIDPQAYTAEQRALLAKHGGKLVTGPNSWRMPEPSAGRITFDKAQYKELEAIWPELHLAVQRKNFGVRMFNVTGVLTYLLRSDKQVVLHLVNYTDYPVENITAFVQGKYAAAQLLTPNSAGRPLRTYAAPDGTAIEIDRLETSAAVLLETGPQH